MAIKEAIGVSAPVTGAPEKTMSFETGVTAAKKPRDGASFFPLTVDIEERMYAAGKIPGSFFRREGRASEQAILVCRLTDRPLRPAFPDGFRNEVHIVGTVLGADQENPYDVMAINAASCALSMSEIPFEGPIGATRIAWSAEGEWIPFPTYEEGAASNFEMVVAGRMLDDGDVAISMVEAGGTEGAAVRFAEGAPMVTEDVLASGLEAAKTWIREVIELQRKLIAQAGAKPTMAYTVTADTTDDIYEAVAAAATDRVAETQMVADKAERGQAEDALKSVMLLEMKERFGDEDGFESKVGGALRKLNKKVVRDRIVQSGLRIDGRGPAELRGLESRVGVVSTAHGSGLFTRGETQVLNITTLGTKRMDQMIDGIDPIDRKRYINRPRCARRASPRAGHPRVR